MLLLPMLTIVIIAIVSNIDIDINIDINIISPGKPIPQDRPKKTGWSHCRQGRCHCRTPPLSEVRLLNFLSRRNMIIMVKMKVMVMVKMEVMVMVKMKGDGHARYESRGSDWLSQNWPNPLSWLWSFDSLILFIFIFIVWFVNILLESLWWGIWISWDGEASAVSGAHLSTAKSTLFTP